MSYVIYEIESTRFVRVMRDGYWQDAEYATKGAATAAFNRLVAKADAKDRSGWTFKQAHAIAERGYFHKHIEKMRKTRNILNPQAGEFEVPVNTPLCCDPGSETYHSM